MSSVCSLLPPKVDEEGTRCTCSKPSSSACRLIRPVDIIAGGLPSNSSSLSSAQERKTFCLSEVCPRDEESRSSELSRSCDCDDDPNPSRLPVDESDRKDNFFSICGPPGDENLAILVSRLNGENPAWSSSPNVRALATLLLDTERREDEALLTGVLKPAWMGEG